MDGDKSNFIERFGLNYLVGQWHIDLNYGIEKFSEHMANVEMASMAGLFEMFKEEKAKSGEVKVVSLTTFEPEYVEDIKSVNTDSIVELSYSGVMRDNDGLCSYGVKTLASKLYASYANPSVKGILLNLDSGGGQSQSGYTLQAAIADKNKPVVVLTPFMGSAALNGALTATERIGLSENAQAGSIGSLFSLHLPTINILKEQYKDIYSRVSPNKNKSFRELLAGNYTALEDEATENAKIFQNQVKKYLNLNPSLQEDTLSGGMFYAKEAVKRGLLDSIGTKKFALKRLQTHIKNNFI